MPLMLRKNVRLAGIEFGLGLDAAQVERVRAHGAYRWFQHRMARVRGPRRSSLRTPAANVEAFRPTPPASVANDPAAAALWERVASIGWYHTIDLGHGVVTPGFIDNRPTVPLFGFPDDLTGKRCLDIGTYDGFWAFEFERRGASESIGIDVDSPVDYDLPRPHRLAAEARASRDPSLPQEDWNQQMAPVGMQWPGLGFRTAAEILGSRARREGLNVYDLSPERLGMFDLVLISQLLLRMRDPQTVLENMISVLRPGGRAIVAEGYDPELERLSVPASRFVGVRSMGIWWSHSIKSMALMMETAGFENVHVVSRFEVTNRAGRFPKVVLHGYAPGSSGAGAATLTTKLHA